MPLLRRADVALHYERLGSGEAVLLLNGIMMTTSSWIAQVDALSESYEVVLHDFRGQLRSPKPAGPVRLEEHVDDLLALLDELELDRVHLAGTSYGGEIGLMFAVAHPSRVRSLAVIASTSEVGPALKARVDPWARTAREAPELLYDSSVRDIFSPAFVAAHLDVVDVARARVAACPPAFFRGLAELVEAFETLGVTARLPEVRCPTLVVAAELDLLKPLADSRRIADAIPGAELVVVEGAGHAVVVEQPARISAELLRFLESQRIPAEFDRRSTAV
jgi:3-oxoadipate enol-lactonase